MTVPDRMHLALVLRAGGYHRAAWRYPGSSIDAALDLALYTEMAQLAEAAHLDALFVADSLALSSEPWDDLAQPLEPFTLLGAVAARTRHVGLIATASTTYSEPYNLARQLASLDHLSAGRAGWNVVTTADPSAAGNFGHAEHQAHASRYRRAGEFVDVAKALWDSWDDDAIVLDRAGGVQTDRNRIRAIHHEGEFFKVRGPLNIPRPPQGHPLLVHAGQSPDGLAAGARYAEFIFAVQHDIDDARRFVQDVRQRLIDAGRAPDTCRILPGLLPIVGATEQEAREQEQALRELGGQSNLLAEVSGFLDLDLAALDPDRPIDLSQARSPEGFVGPQSWFRQLYTEIARAQLSPLALQKKYRDIGRSGHLQVVGTPEQIADRLEEWFRSGACHGFNVMATTLPQSLRGFTQEVVPLLAKRGVFRSDYEHDTLRGHLGLERPSDRSIGS